MSHELATMSCVLLIMTIVIRFLQISLLTKLPRRTSSVNKLTFRPRFLASLAPTPSFPRPPAKIPLPRSPLPVAGAWGAALLECLVTHLHRSVPMAYRQGAGQRAEPVPEAMEATAVVVVVVVVEDILVAMDTDQLNPFPTSFRKLG